MQPIVADVIIVGAGPAGLAAAIAAGRSALVLERNPHAGKKLLLSGSGQCNFTNSLESDEFLRACGKYAHFLKPAFHTLDNRKLIALLESAGCPVLIRADGKAFPASLRSEDVRNVLLSSAEQHGARFNYGTLIRKVSYSEGFHLTDAQGREYRCERLILAGGGASWQQTGSDGSIYTLAEALGHTIASPQPALAAVEIAAYSRWRECAGVSLHKVTARFKTETDSFNGSGDLLWTHTGLSGPLIINNSHRLRRSDKILLHLVPRAEERIPELLLLNPKQNVLSALKRTGLPASLLNAILAAVDAEPGIACSELRKDARKRVTKALSCLELSISAVESLRTAMATSGGVVLSEVKAANLASKLCPGLFFAGEMLDYDLPTGGFNIQMAVSTGWLAGLSAKKYSR